VLAQSRQAVEDGALAGVRVADDGDRRNRLAVDRDPLERNAWKVDAACGLLRRCLAACRGADGR